MDKRGISAIVATVLVILITVAGISIIWVAIVPMISESLEFGALEGRVNVVSTGGYTVYDSSREVAIVQIRRDVDDGVMNRVRISFIIDGNSVSSNVVAPESGAVKTYSFDLSGLGVPESVGVAPIFVSGSGSEKEGSSSSVDLGSGAILNIPSKVEWYDIGEDYYGDYSKLPSDGIVSLWKFSGNADDSIGTNHGSLVDNAHTNENGELVLDGAGDYVVLPNNAFGLPRNEFSFTGWINNEVLGRIIIWSGEFQVTMGAGNLVNARLEIGRTSVSKVAGLNSWYYFAWTYDGTNEYLYINDGAPAQLVDAAGTNAESNTYFGKDETAVTYQGMMDNIMFYDRVLSPEEVGVIYEAQKKS